MASSSSSAAHLLVDEVPIISETAADIAARALRLELEGEKGDAKQKGFLTGSPPTKRKKVFVAPNNEEQGTRAEGDKVDDCASGTHSSLPEPKPTKKLDERIFEPFLPKNSSARSDVWSTTAFMKIRVKDSRVVCKDFAVCSLCRTIFKCKKGNTSTLTRHLKACSEKRKDTPSVLHYIKDPTPLAGDQRGRLLEACVDLIVAQALPFTVTESVAFRKLIQLATDLGARNGRPFDADRSLPSAKAVSTAVKERYSKVKEEVKSRLKRRNRPLQMQFDAWKTYHKGEEVLATTVVLEKDENEGAEPVLIALRKLESGQGEDIAGTLQTVLDDYDVRKDEVLFLSDSCSANIKALTTLGAASIPCYGHLLQLAVKAGTYPATTVSNPATGDTQKTSRSRRLANRQTGPAAKANEETLSIMSTTLNDMMHPLPEEESSSVAGLLTTVSRLVAVARRTKMNVEIAEQPNCVRLCIRNDTRWNSSLRMVSSVIRSWEAIISIFSKNNRLQSFESLLSKKPLLEGIQSMLQPLAVATDKMQAVRPFVAMDTIAQLEKCWRFLSREDPTDFREIKNAKVLMRDAFREKNSKREERAGVSLTVIRNALASCPGNRTEMVSFFGFDFLLRASVSIGFGSDQRRRISFLFRIFGNNFRFDILTL